MSAGILVVVLLVLRAVIAQRGAPPATTGASKGWMHVPLRGRSALWALALVVWVILGATTAVMILIDHAFDNRRNVVQLVVQVVIFGVASVMLFQRPHGPQPILSLGRREPRSGGGRPLSTGSDRRRDPARCLSADRAQYL